MMERAPRFEIRAPLRYRLKGDSKWWQGTIENISRSGVLFRGEEFAEPHTRLEISLVLPDGVFGVRATKIECSGTVVRSERPADGQSLPSLASTISCYRIARS
jgi:hypothetical protein